MSAYAESKTTFKDGKLLIDCLREMGFSEVENHIGNPQPLVGYQGDFRTADGYGHTRDANLAMKADIILRRKEVGSSSNDIGFVLGSDGTYKAIVSEFDSTRYDSNWVRTLSNNYAEKGVMQVAAKKGLRFTGRKIVKGKVKLSFVQV